MLTPRTKLGIIWLVGTVWALNFAAGLVPPLHYKPDQAINGIFMTVVGGLVASGFREKKSEDNGKEGRE